MKLPEELAPAQTAQELLPHIPMSHVSISGVGHPQKSTAPLSASALALGIQLSTINHTADDKPLVYRADFQAD